MAMFLIHQPQTFDEVGMESSANPADGSPANQAGPPAQLGDGLVAVLHRLHADPSRNELQGPSNIASQLTGGSFEVVDMAIDRTTIDRLTALRPDVVLVLHDPLGFDVVQLCRDVVTAVGCRIIVVATDPVDETTIVDALDAGADDFVPGDMSSAVLGARVRAALRAQPTRSAALTTIEVGDVVIDRRAHSVHVAGQVVRCPPVQFVLLATFAESPNVAIGPDQLLRTVWGARPDEVHPRRLRIAVSVLRGILGDGPRRPVIETLSRVGYRLVVPGDASAAPPSVRSVGR
ncbi:MAG: response regulator transcription factor [Ilumatobacteraceae bacterium]